MITKWRKLSSGVGGARGESRSRKLPQGDSGEKQRRNHSQRASGEKRTGSNKGKILREKYIDDLETYQKTEKHSQQQAEQQARRAQPTAGRRAQPTAGKKSTANRRQSEPKGCDRDKDEVNKAKDFSKTVIEQGDVMETLPRVISIIGREMTKNPAFVQKDTEMIHGKVKRGTKISCSLTEDLNVKSIQ